MIRSLCEIEFELDSISTELGEQLAFERALPQHHLPPPLRPPHGADPHYPDGLGGDEEDEPSSSMGSMDLARRIPAVSSHASLLSLGVDYSHDYGAGGAGGGAGGASASGGGVCGGGGGGCGGGCGGGGAGGGGSSAPSSQRRLASYGPDA